MDGTSQLPLNVAFCSPSREAWPSRVPLWPLRPTVTGRAVWVGSPGTRARHRSRSRRRKGRKTPTTPRYGQKQSSELGVLQSIFLEHRSMKAVLPYLWGPSPYPCSTPNCSLEHARRDWQWGSPLSIPQSWGLWAASVPGTVTLVCMFKTPLKLWDVSSELPMEPLNTPKKFPALIPAARAGVSRWGWEQSPALAPLGPGDGKQQVGVSALCLCLQRKHSLKQRVPQGLEWGEMAGTERPCCKGLRWLLQSSELKYLRLRVTKGIGKPGPPLSCLERPVGQRPWPGPELVSLGRRDRTPGSWAAWLTTCKLPAPPASPA